MRMMLKDVCQFYSGTGFPEIYQGANTGKYPFYKVGDISNNVADGNIFLQHCGNYISDEVVSAIHGTIIPSDTVVFAKIGEALKKNRRAITTCNCLVDNNAMGITPRSEIIRTKYFYYFMCKLRMQEYAEATAVPSVRKSRLEQIWIDVPGLDEQESIEKKLDVLTEIIKAYQQQLYYFDILIKARFVEMFGDPVENSMGWKQTILKMVCKKITDGEHGTVPRESMGHPFLNAKHINQNGSIDWQTVTYISDEIHKRIYKRCNPEPGDILMTTTGTIGNVAITPVTEEFSMDRGITLLKLDQAIVLPHFIAWLLRFDGMQMIMTANIHASAIGHLFLNKVEQLPVIVPPIQLQEQFASFASQIDKSKAAVQQALAESQLLFDSLMQKYFG